MTRLDDCATVRMLWYVDHRSLWLDIKILWLTVKKVLVRDGISAAGEATMPRFTGSKP